MTTRKAMAAAARAAGEQYFEDPKGCKRGHQVFYSSNGSCVLCQGIEAKFQIWVAGMGYEGHDREVARTAWLAARQRNPVTLMSLKAMLLEAPTTSERIAAETGLTARHVRRLLAQIPGATYQRKGYQTFWSIDKL